MRRERPQLCARRSSLSLSSAEPEAAAEPRVLRCTSRKPYSEKPLPRAVPFYDEVHGVYHLMYQDHVCIAPGHGPDIGHVVSRDFVYVCSSPACAASHG